MKIEKISISAFFWGIYNIKAQKPPFNHKVQAINNTF